jgi:phosphoserine phosphatase/NAD-dependent SIR2 family protein deacetylase
MTDLLSVPLPDSHVAELARLAKSDQLVLFVGAGISLQAKPKDKTSTNKLPLWQMLASTVAKHCGKKSEHYIDLFDLFDSIETSQSRGKLEDAIRVAIPDELFEPSDVHRELCAVPWHIIVTTNYDSLLDRAIPEHSPIITEENYEWLSRESSRRPRLVHLHGTLGNPHTLTGSDYGRWDEQHPIAYNFLENMALSKTILFVGYSLSDPYLKFGLLPWLHKAVGKRGKRHYAWMWDANPEQIQLFDKRDSITVMPIRTDSDWTTAFQQLREQVLLLGKRGKKAPRARHDQAALSPDEALVNGYKLYFYRMNAKKSIKVLSQETGIPPLEINKLEQVKTKTVAGPDCFKAAIRQNLAKIEKALNCVGALEYGGEKQDDFLAKYIMFYKVNMTIGKKSNRTKVLSFVPDTKAVVFDFGGTLTRSTSNRSTWERMWESVGYTSVEAGHHHRKFLAREITHQVWCDVTAAKLREKGFSLKHLRQITSGVELLPGLEEMLNGLRAQGTSVYIVSGSIREIIAGVLGPTFSLFSDVKANELLFDSDEIIKSIRGTPFDFQGKAKFITRIASDLACDPIDILFVGNSLNDSWASRSGARTLCVNPVDVDFSNTLVWYDYIRDMSNLTEILPFATRSQCT